VPKQQFVLLQDSGSELNASKKLRLFLTMEHVDQAAEEAEESKPKLLSPLLTEKLK
jgi:hypothetical protein